MTPTTPERPVSVSQMRYDCFAEINLIQCRVACSRADRRVMNPKSANAHTRQHERNSARRNPCNFPWLGILHYQSKLLASGRKYRNASSIVPVVRYTVHVESLLYIWEHNQQWACA